MTSPICTVNGGASINGVNVTGGTTVTIALASTAGVTQWSIQCIGTDDLNLAATVNAGLSVNITLFQATYTQPNTNGAVLIFQSVVNNGKDVNNNVQPTYTTTFGVYTTTGGGVRLAGINETTEGDSVYGWTSKFNSIARTLGGAGSFGSIAVGSAPLASTGDIRLSKSFAIKARRSDNAADVGIMSEDGFEDLVIGDSANTVTISLASKGTGVQSTSFGGATALSVSSGSFVYSPAALGSDVAPPNSTLTAQSAQAGAATNRAGANIVLSPGSGATTNGTPGSLVAALGAITGTGSEPLLQVTRASSFVGGIGAYAGAPTTFSLLWLGPGISPSTTNFVVLGSGTTSVYLNCASAAGIISIAFAGNNATAGSILLTGTTGSFAWAAASTAPALTQTAPGSDVATVNMSISAQAAFATASTNVTGGNLNLSGGAGKTVTTSGLVQLQVNGTTSLAVGPNGLGLGVSAVTINATGNTTFTQAQFQNPLISVNTITLTGAVTLIFPNVIGVWLVDVSKITLGGFTVAFKCGTSAASTSLTPTTSAQLIMVSCPGSNGTPSVNV